MPMIDVYASNGSFPNPHDLARDLARGGHALGTGP